MYQALYRKYRPMRFGDVVGQEHITETLRRQVAANRTSHAYIFVGGRGTGKTTCAKILARALNCENPQSGEPCNACPSCLGIMDGSILDVVEIDAASNNGVDNVRTIREEAVFSPTSVRKRVYIIDEVHMLSTSAFNALLKIMEEPPEHLVFILATTELNKVPATILSRTQRYNFKRLTPADIEGRIRYVCDSEGISITDGAVTLLARLADGAMRDALSLLDQCLSGGEVTEERVLSGVGIAGSGRVASVFRALKGGDTALALGEFEDIYASGADPAGTLGELLSLIRDMLIVRVAGKGGEGLITGTLSRAALDELSDGVPTGALLRAASDLGTVGGSMRDVRDRRTAAEVALVKLGIVLGGAQFEGYDEPKAAPIPASEPKPAAPRPAPKPIAEAPMPVAEAPKRADEAPKQASEAPKPSMAPMPNPSGTEPTWDEILEAAKGELGTYVNILGNKADVAAWIKGNVLTVATENPFVKTMTEQQQVSKVLTETASRLTGRPVQLAIQNELPRAEGASADLDYFKQFGDFVTFK